METEINCGIVTIKTKVSFSDAQRENWARFVDTVADYRFLSNQMHAEYVGEVFESVSRLRQEVLPEAVGQLRPDDVLRKRYNVLGTAIRDFLTNIRVLGREKLADRDLNLMEITPVGHQWIFVHSLAELRREFLTEVRDNCLVFGIEFPEEFQSAHKYPDEVAEKLANEMVPIKK